MASHHYLKNQKKFIPSNPSNILDLIKKSKLQKIADKKANIILISSTLVVFALITKIIVF
tara:strand:- start:357 stop:536 length:180 start_codon:yes stop_codon:yes gene_type:complete